MSNGETINVNVPNSPILEPGKPKMAQPTRALIVTLEGRNPIPVEVFEDRMDVIRPSLVSYIELMHPGRNDVASIISALFEGFTYPLYNPDSIEKHSPINASLISFLNDFRNLLEYPTKLVNLSSNFERLFTNYRRKYVEMEGITDEQRNIDLQLILVFEKLYRTLMVSE